MKHYIQCILLCTLTFLSCGYTKGILPSNGFKYVALFIAKTHMDYDNLHKVALSLDTTSADIIALHEKLTEWQIDHVLSENKSMLSAIQGLNDSDILVFEFVPKYKNSNPILRFVKKDNDIYNYYDIPTFKKVPTTEINLITKLSDKISGRFIVIHNKKHKKLMQHDTLQHTFNNKNMTLIQKSNTEIKTIELHKINEISLPKIIDIGLIPVGGINTTVCIPIHNNSNKTLNISNIVGQCNCIKKITYSETIPPNKTGYINALIDPKRYIDIGVIDTFIQYSIGDMARIVETRILGAIDYEKIVIADPTRLFYKFNNTKTKSFDLHIFSTSEIDKISLLTDSDILHITSPLNSETTKVEKFIRIKTYHITINPLNFSKQLTGVITIKISDKGINRELNIPYNFINL